MVRDLESELYQAYNGLGILPEQQESISVYLNLIKNKDIPTWEHSVRVGNLGKEVAEYTKVVHPKALAYAGWLHDVGKTLVDSNSLKKKDDFTEKDMKELEKHVMYGYNILKDIHDFSARVLLYHHYFQENGYPKRIPVSNIDFSKGNELMALYCGRFLSIVDFYDALKTKRNYNFVV